MTVESTPRAGISRRRIVQGAAWATPAILIATASPQAAASGKALSTAEVRVTHNGQHDQVQITLPTDVGINGAELKIEWLPSGTNPTATVAGWNLDSSSSASTVPTTYKRTSVPAGSVILVEFFKAEAQPTGEYDFRLTLTGVNTNTGLTDTAVIERRFVG